MKLSYFKIFIIFLFLFPVIKTNTFAQEPIQNISAKRDVLKFDIVLVLGRVAYVSYERVFSESSSGQFGLLLGRQIFFGSFAYRYYLTETPPPKGKYISPVVGIGRVMDSVGFGVGFLIGSQSFYKQKITLDVNIGPAFFAGPNGSGFAPFGGVTVGVAF